MKHFYPFQNIDVEQVQFALGVDRNGKPLVSMTYGPERGELSMVSAPAVTMWPRCSGDGNFGTMWGPTDPMKAKYTLDLNDMAIQETENTHFKEFMTIMELIDDKLCDFVTEHQLKILGRKNLKKEEVSMLQIRSVRPKYDKITGALNGHSLNLSTAKYKWDGVGGKYATQITVCDLDGKAVQTGVVAAGDVVAVTMYANQVYNGVGGDKFGIHWAFQDVQVICQRTHLESKSEVSAFQGGDYSFGRAYVTSELPTYNDQFGIEATA